MKENKNINKEQNIITPLADEIAAALYLKSTANTLKNSRSTGILWGVPAPKYLKCGRRILYRFSELDNWINQFGEFHNTGEAAANGSV
jgi:hypothetical protein